MMSRDSVPALDEFHDEVLGVLSRRYPARSVKDFLWGQGSDSVALFEEASPEEERVRVAQAKELMGYLWESGLGWITGPVAYGGRGLPAEYQRVFDEIARGFELPRRDPLLASVGIVAPTIAAYASDAANRNYLAKMHCGQLVGCQLFSEPGCGSDLASVTTTARRDGKRWLISGQKVWTSGAHYSDVGCILCRTSAEPRYHNLTMFLVDMHAPGVEVRPLRQMTGGAAFNEVFIDNVWVEDHDRVGEVDGGWPVALYTLANERTAVGTSGSGAGLFKIDRYVQMMKAFNATQNPLLRAQFADLVCQLRIAKMCLDRQRAQRLAGLDSSRLASITKLQLSENYTRISAFVSAVLGLRLTADTDAWGSYAWSELILGVPGTRIGGGTDEILHNIIGERVLGLPKEPSGAAVFPTVPAGSAN